MSLSHFNCFGASDRFFGLPVTLVPAYRCNCGFAGFSRNGKQEPDTVILRGVPSRWFAEPRVSSKPSLLVTHTIFSTFGGIKYVFFSSLFSGLL